MLTEKGSKRSYSAKLTCSEYNKNRLMNECKITFLKYHPEFDGMKLTQEFLLTKVLDHYIE
jgi:hypothetical protein